MRVRYVPLLLTVLLASAFLPLAAEVSAQEWIVGAWVGELKVGALVLHIVFNVSSSGGELSATMDSPDQNAKGIPVSRVVVSGGDVLFEVGAAGASVTGKLTGNAGSIDGSWIQSGQSLPIVLKKQEGGFSYDRPQEPRPPFPYASIEVSIPGTAPGVRLAGTLTVPPGKGPFPAVVLVTGSGPQDRDESLLGHRPFLVIADFLSRSGIAVLRYDDRGVGKSSGNFGTSTTLDFADDAEAAFTYLTSRPEVDRARAGMAGHSEGGLIAPIVASRNQAVRFIVLLAGPGLPGDTLLLLQNAALARASGMDEKRLSIANSLNAALYAMGKREDDPTVITARARKLMEDVIDAETSLTVAEKAEARKAIPATIAPLATPWFLVFLRLDPAAYLPKVRVPVLALNGSMDLQVPAVENLAGIERSLNAAGNSTYRIVKMDGLNHLFQHSSTGLPQEYGTITETFAPEALAAIRDFVLAP